MNAHVCTQTVYPRPGCDRRASAPWPSAQRQTSGTAFSQQTNLCSLYSRRCSLSVRAADTQQAETDAEIQIEGIDTRYCDDFECTSSPAVERNLRSLSRDITRVSRWTASLFAIKVKYQVGTLCRVLSGQASALELLVHFGVLAPLGEPGMRSQCAALTDLCGTGFVSEI